MVFPWMKNGDILNYLSKHPNANRVKLVRPHPLPNAGVQSLILSLQMLGVARGLAYMHQHEPPMVHSAMQPVRHFSASRAYRSSDGVFRATFSWTTTAKPSSPTSA